MKLDRVLRIPLPVSVKRAVFSIARSRKMTASALARMWLVEKASETIVASNAPRKLAAAQGL
jgi:hypothetical protein